MNSNNGDDLSDANACPQPLTPEEWALAIALALACGCGLHEAAKAELRAECRGSKQFKESLILGLRDLEVAHYLGL